jgi:hypothetical protein
MLAVDMSNYTDPLTAATIQQLKDAGVGHVIIQAVDPPPGYPAGRTRAQIQACIDAGLTVDAYIWMWFDLDTADIQRKLGLLDGLAVHQLWLDVEDTAAIKYDQPTTEAKVTDALAACDGFTTLSGAKTGVYSGRWFWVDRRYMANTSCFADRELWDANYDDVADAALGFTTYGGWQRCVIKQYRGTTAVGGVGGLDVNVLSVDKAAELAGAGGSRVAGSQTTQPGGAPQTDQPSTPDQPTAPGQPSTPDQPATPGQPSTSDGPDGPDQAAGPPASAARETPDDWLWPTWYEAAIQYKAIAEELGQQLAAIKQAQTSPAST